MAELNNNEDQVHKKKKKSKNNWMLFAKLYIFK